MLPVWLKKRVSIWEACQFFPFRDTPTLNFSDGFIFLCSRQIISVIFETVQKNEKYGLTTSPKVNTILCGRALFFLFFLLHIHLTTLKIYFATSVKWIQPWGHKPVSNRLNYQITYKAFKASLTKTSYTLVHMLPMVCNI